MNKGRDNINTFRNEIEQRLTKPWKQSAFHGYFWGIIITFAIVSLIVPLFNVETTKAIQTIAISAASYFIALVGSSSIDISLITSTKFKASFSIYSFVIFIFSIILFALSVLLPSFWGIIPAGLGLVFAILVWIVANSDKDIYNDEKYSKKLEESIIATSAGYNKLYKKIEDEV
jgi:hypothetical protein